MYFYRPNNFGTKMTEMIRLYIYSIEISHTYVGHPIKNETFSIVQ